MRKLAAIALIMLGIGVLCAFFVFDKSDLTKFKGEPYLQEKTVDASAIKSIHTETDTFNVKFVRGTTDDIQVRLEGNASKKNVSNIVFNAEPKGDTLFIEGDVKDQFFVGISIINLKLTVELPEKMWKSVDIESDTGNIDIDQLEADEIKIKSDTGNLNAANYSTGLFVFESDTGNVALKDGAGRLKGETDTGNIRIESAEIQSDVSLKSDTGNVTIHVDKQPHSAAIRIQKDIGSSKVEWDGFSDRNDSKNVVDGKIGSGEIQIDIQSEVGNVKLGSR